MGEDVGEDSVEISASSVEDVLSPHSFLRCVLPRGRAQVRAPDLDPATDDEDVQAKVFVSTMLDAEFPRQHLVQFLPAGFAPAPGAAASSTDRRLPADPKILPGKVVHVRDDRKEFCRQLCVASAVP